MRKADFSTIADKIGSGFKARRVRSFLRFFFRLIRRALIVFFLLATVIILILYFSGGSSPALKQGAEAYLSQATGLRTEIGTLEHFRFFPDVEFAARDITLTRSTVDAPADAPADTNANSDSDAAVTTGQPVPAVKLSYIHVSRPFWDMISGRRRLGLLQISGFEAREGILFPRALTIETAQISTPSATTKPQKTAQEKDGKHNDRTVFRINGAYGDAAFFATALSDSRDYFDLAKMADLDFSIGALAFTAKQARLTPGRINLESFALKAEQDTAAGDVTFKTGKASHLKGTFRLNESHIKADLHLKFGERIKNLRGTIRAQQLQLADIGAPARLEQQIRDALTGPPPAARATRTTRSKTDIESGAKTKSAAKEVSLADLLVNIAVKIDALKIDGNNIGAIDFPVRVRDQILQAGPLEGRLLGSVPAASIQLDAHKMPAAFSLTADLKEADYSALTKFVDKGTLTIRIDARADIRTLSDLAASMTGHATLIAGRGQLASVWLNKITGGLINIMLPSLKGKEQDLALNCAIAEFDIADGQAKAAALLVDTQKVSMVGEGYIDLQKKRYNLSLSPKTKDVAFLDVAMPVKVTGALESPRFSPEALGLLGKLGGAALGMINPAFLAFSLTDLGLTEDHPCAAYIKPQ